MSNKISVPDFDFTGFYYPQILEAAVKWLRVNVPEISSETPSEPAIQLLRVYALIGHLNNVLLDQVAHEALFSTVALRDSLQAHLKLIGYKLAADIPSKTDLLITLAKSYTTTTTVTQKSSLFSTKRTEVLEPIVFELDSATTISRTDQITKAFVYDASSDSYTDITTALNTNSSTTAILPATPAFGDIFYVCHDTTMSDRLKITGLTTSAADIVGYRWEYGNTSVSDTLADSVTVVGSTLKIVIDSLLDTDGSIDYSGMAIRVTFNPTGEFEDIPAYASGSGGSQYDLSAQNNFILTTSHLGQTTVSLDPTDYTVGTSWNRLDGITDDTNNGNSTLEKNGNFDFIVPQNTQDKWDKKTVNGVEGFWVRLRIISVGSAPVAPVVDRVIWNNRNTYILSTATQGQPRSQNPLASSTGAASQFYDLSTSSVINGSVVAYVDNVSWTEVDNFINSTNIDNHYIVEINTEGIARVTFGDGINGRIPPAGVNNIRVEYRTGAENNGNVGSNTIINNRSGSSNVKRVTNPRPASGWVRQRGSTKEDIELLKTEAPASLRSLNRAITLGDVEYLTKQFSTSDGRKPFIRAKAIAEDYGAKTVGLYVVGSNGNATTLSDRQELADYFNGNTLKSIEGVLIVNHQVIVKDYSSVTVDVTVSTIGGDKTKIETALRALIGPTKLKANNVDYQFEFGQDVTISRITSTILGCDVDTGGVLDVTVSTPSSNVSISDKELPKLGTLSVTVSET